MTRNDVSAKGLYRLVYSVFENIQDYRKNHGNIKISIADAIMSGLSIFALKFPSLLKYEEETKKNTSNLTSLFFIGKIPSDTQMREVLDNIDPDFLRPSFTKIFSSLQRGNELKKFIYLEDHYLIALDGTGEFSSSKIKCPHCLEKKFKTGVVFHHQLLGASLIHPEHNKVIPLFPEFILQEDGKDKGDCERTATKRWITKFRQEHPKMKAIIVEDALGANIPNLKTMQENNLRYILGVKPDGHKYLFEQFKINEKHNLINNYEFYEIIGDKVKKKRTHKFNFINDLELIASDSTKVNFLDYEEITEYLYPDQDKKKIGTIKKHFSWVTDLKLTKNNINQVMRAGRARWRIENENFKTLKTESAYNFEHSYGHGHKFLCSIFATLTILSLLIDQSMEISCSLFKKVLEHVKRKSYLWERMRGCHVNFVIKSWTEFFHILLGEIKGNSS